MKVKAVIFDLFGTLMRLQAMDIDDFLYKSNILVDKKVFNNAFKEVFQLNRFEKYEDGVELLAEKIGASENEAFKQGQLKFFEELDHSIVPIEKTFAVLAIAKKIGMKTAILSNSFQIPDEVVNKFHLDLIDHILLSCDTKVLKPDIQAFTNVADVLDVYPKECLFIGDNYEKDLLPASLLARVAQLIEHLVANEVVAGLSPVSRFWGMVKRHHVGFWSHYSRFESWFPRTYISL